MRSTIPNHPDLVWGAWFGVPGLGSKSFISLIKLYKELNIFWAGVISGKFRVFDLGSLGLRSLVWGPMVWNLFKAYRMVPPTPANKLHFLNQII